MPLTNNLTGNGPESSLYSGEWVKLICGASNEDLASIEDLCGIYTLAGVDCIDVASNIAVVSAARRGIKWAMERGGKQPWLMVSLSDGDDPHFRKAWFDPSLCPSDCPRPCQNICPTLAIDTTGIVPELCYGCGRCLPSCPFDLIHTFSQVTDSQDIPNLLLDLSPDVVELHTQLGRLQSFSERVKQIQISGIPTKYLAVSLGLDNSKQLCSGQLKTELWERYKLILQSNLCPIWQLDGRPMSGDIGTGTAYASIRLLNTLLHLLPPGPIQLAGGTNSQTILLVEEAFPNRSVSERKLAGVAFGGIARRLLQPLILKAETMGLRLLKHPDLRDEAVRLAYSLVSTWRRN
ncbi:putative ldpA protein (chromatophore) [Paulinella micropora]|uniref:LdpA protein n=1 Tax=Paulinella micropora TaxID=1928728 RepID=A0A1S6YIJ3_9EUKA|nr:putative ldpA protein [Paulinella micropora]BBL86344.1 putative ldpA protein [Paulinella micropora]